MVYKTKAIYNVILVEISKGIGLDVAILYTGMILKVQLLGSHSMNTKKQLTSGVHR